MTKRKTTEAAFDAAAKYLYAQLRASGKSNVMESMWTASGGERFTITLQRVTGATPLELLRRHAPEAVVRTYTTGQRVCSFCGIEQRKAIVRGYASKAGFVQSQVNRQVSKAA